MSVASTSQYTKRPRNTPTAANAALTLILFISVSRRMGFSAAPLLALYIQRPGFVI